MKRKTIITVSVLTALILSVFILTGNEPQVKAPQTDNHAVKKADGLKEPAQKDVPKKNGNLTSDRTEAVSDSQIQAKPMENPAVPDEAPDEDIEEDPRAEDQREIERMKQALPGNMWIPGEPSEEEAEKQQKILKDVILLENKIRKDTATTEEEKIYYEYKIKTVQDKIDIIQYYQKRSAELEIETSRPYLSEKDIEHGNKAILELEQQRKEYDKLLSEVPDEKEKLSQPGDNSGKYLPDEKN